MAKAKHLYIFNFRTMQVNIRLRIISTIILSITIYGFCSYIFPKNHENIMLRNYQFAKKFDRMHKSDILFIGNSRIECGINTIPISKKTGLSCYNLGIPRTTFNSKNYFDFVWSKLDTNNFPIIVVGLSPSTIMYYPERDGISNEAIRGLGGSKDLEKGVEQLIDRMNKLRSKRDLPVRQAMCIFSFG